MRFFRVGAIILAALWLAGCATSATNTLSQATRDALRIDTVDVAFAPDAQLSLQDATIQFRASSSGNDPAAMRAHLEQKAAGPIRSALNAEVLPAFRGTEPARLRVTVRYISVPSVVVRLLAGGSHHIRADIELIGVKSGKTLVSAPDFNGNAPAGGGLMVAFDQMLPDPIDRVSRSFASALRQWLKTGQAFSSG